MIFIAEIGLNHNGNFGLLYELIKQAKLSGANIVKFQLGWRAKENEINHIDEKTLSLIIKISSYYEIEPMFSIFTRDAFIMAKKFNLRRYKIASRTLIDDFELAQMIVSENKETFLSLGFWGKKEFPFINYSNVKRLWCKSNYPTAPWEINDFPSYFSSSYYAGISDHTVGIELSLLAISRGAEIVERHFTLDKSDTTIRDHALSLNPEEFKNLVTIGTSMKKIINTIS